MKACLCREAFEDLIFVGLDRLPDLGEEVKTDHFTATVGGGAVITAVQAARLGMKTDLISALGPAAVTRLKHERRQRHQPSQAQRTARDHRRALDDDDRAFVTFNGVNAKLEARLAKPASPKLVSFAEAKAATVAKREGGRAGGPTFTSASTRTTAAQWTTHRQRGCASRASPRRGISAGTSRSTSDRGLIDLIDALDFVFVNELEARLYTGEATLEAAVTHWRQRKAITIIKHGEAARCGWRPTATSTSRRRRVKVVDTTGAGDCVQRRLPGGVDATADRRSNAWQQGNKVGARSTPTSRWHMKVAIIGGAGVRVPLLVGGLSRSDLGISEIASVRHRSGSPARHRRSGAREWRRRVRVTSAATPEAAIEGADFVITSIRVGGAAQRAKDEAAAIALGVVGQETVGPVGFAMAVRTIPAMVEYGRLVARLAPRAWLINFSNPVSLITQAVHQETDARLIGICDTPMEMFEDAAHALGLPASVCSYDYFGLNHLGWLRDVLFEGEGRAASHLERRRGADSRRIARRCSNPSACAR